MNRKTFLIIINQRDKEMQLAIDMALAISAYDNAKLTVLFQNDSLLELNKQHAETMLQKQIKAWPWYGIEHIYAAEKDLSYPTTDLIIDAKPLSTSAIQNLTEQSSVVLRY